MGSLYRSEEMSLCQLFLQTDAAYSCVAELGELGLVQFRDLNPHVNAFQRKFVNEVRRCDEMERKLKYLDAQAVRHAIPIQEEDFTPDAPLPKEMVDLEATFEKLESELREVSENEEMLMKNFTELTELKHILKNTSSFFDEQEGVHAVTASLHHGGQANPAYDHAPDPFDQTPEHEKSSDLSFVTGVIRRERQASFETLLWRACRGNVFLRTADIDELITDPATGDPVQKMVFIIFFQGAHLRTRVKKICDGFRASLYPCPNTTQERRDTSIGVMTRIEDLKSVLAQTTDHRDRVLSAAARSLRIWLDKVRKLKAVFHTLNLFNLDVTQKCLIAECWCPSADLDKIQLALKKGTDDSGSSVPSILNRMETSEEPPTFHRTNKFTRGFQNIVDAYGMASYRECNPAPYTIISFPFLFAVMFGDTGHGMLMTAAALVLVLFERRLAAANIRDEIFGTFFSGRYIILLMGLFSIYTGLVYNDFYAKSWNVFGSLWRNPFDRETILSMIPHHMTNGTMHSDAEGGTDKPVLLQIDPFYGYNTAGPYPFGMDPVWSIATNKLNFLNSFKMKISVILGIMQMTFGVFLSLQNYRFHRSHLEALHVFLPQIIFLSSIFIYLCGQVISKWLLFWVRPVRFAVGVYPGSHCAPSLLVGLINMFMFSHAGGPSWSTPANCSSQHVVTHLGDECFRENSQCMLDAFYPGQKYVESALVLLALVCIPWMLLVKPFVQRARHRRFAPVRDMELTAIGDGANGSVEPVDEKPAVKTPHADDAAETSDSGSGSGGVDEFNFSDVFVYQAIHTIEFCLGCVSHTASYLRLWALSLAHSELSEVLWNMVLRGIGLNLFKMKYFGGILLYFIFFVFACLTVGILVLMEGLSAFLHALRLHWVEFQSKFYHGEGYVFAPFDFGIILKEASLMDSH